MLDDLKYIHDRDAQDALGIAEKQWQQLQQDYQLPNFNYQNIENVVVAGMGGSGLAAMVVKVWPGLNVPYEVINDYELPAYVGAKTLLIVSSYSGNTEETLSAFEQGMNKSAQIVVVASGGELIERAKANRLPYLVLPSGYQPRMTLGYQLSALVHILEACNLVEAKKAELHQAASWLHDHLGTWRPDIPTKDNYAKQLALECVGKSAVIYSGPKLFPAAYKWKISFNENAKNIAWCNHYPEFNHNEFLGWTSHPQQKPYAVIELRSNLEHARTQKRFQITEKLLSGQRPAPQAIEVVGSTILEQLLYSIALGDFVSLYLALLNGLNPTPVDQIEKFKTSMQGE
ncbi:MAG TPA: bifunctional phosphoglucose/phosphomannose isomerase [Patescibacteria group bacterium]|nr:bifunctional phosphoglucose/phosphomannose isomerase [Patescibacteria group bacterium]